MSKTLEMVFKDTAGKTRKLSIADPKADLTREAVDSVMAGIIEDKALVNGGNDLAEATEVNLRTVEVLMD